MWEKTKKNKKKIIKKSFTHFTYIMQRSYAKQYTIYAREIKEWTHSKLQ